MLVTLQQPLKQARSLGQAGWVVDGERGGWGPACGALCTAEGVPGDTCPPACPQVADRETEASQADEA